MGIYLGKIQSHYVHSRATYPNLDFPAVKPGVPVRKFQLLANVNEVFYKINEIQVY